MEAVRSSRLQGLPSLHFSLIWPARAICRFFSFNSLHESVRRPFLAALSMSQPSLLHFRLHQPDTSAPTRVSPQVLRELVFLSFHRPASTHRQTCYSNLPSHRRPGSTWHDGADRTAGQCTPRKRRPGVAGRSGRRAIDQRLHDRRLRCRRRHHASVSHAAPDRCQELMGRSGRALPVGWTDGAPGGLCTRAAGGADPLGRSAARWRRYADPGGSGKLRAAP